MVKPPRRARRLAPAWVGIVSALAGLGIGELVAALAAPTSSPLASTGAALIDLAPGWAKEVVVGLFGTGDKVAIITLLVVVVIAAAAGAGILEARRRFTGMAVFAALGILASAAAVTRAGANPMFAFPAVIGALIAIATLRRLIGRLPTEAAVVTSAVSPARPTGTGAPLVAHDSPPTPKNDRPNLRRPVEAAPSRRSFLITTGVTAIVGIAAGVVAQASTAAGRAAEAARAALRLPTSATPVAPPTDAMSFDIDGLSPLITPNADFYRIDTALIVPAVDPTTWTLRIHGMVENEVTLTFAELLALPMQQSDTTLMCVSNYVGGDLISNAVWTGYPIRELLARAVPTADADMVLSTSADGWTASTPLEALTDERNAILAVGMNGELLPAEHGFPVRMVVPGLYGYVSATKWVTDLQVTRFSDATAYWTDRGWGEKGPIKISSRIDVPTRVADGAGSVVVAGVAWAQHTGISKVEVQVDDGAWAEATLADELSIDTWRQWMWSWNATEGEHTITVRATDANGKLQIETPADVLPDGATGYHSVTLTV
ncbi:molybdopterin-dependent oxidoreductase [Naasia lichenicola]|uniref:Oxidoreductase n=1 Tax=Naasia lichenicola TaxID=2565933 RepID=A0A4V3WSM3_9MICO|nr:molybdopterin-dependent oxidoreductase [Naasia lichenicola]THG28667.1 oxidoreductase [Naasia lichenicola]